MKTIAITIDERTLSRLDRITTAGNGPWKSRSQAVRQAVQQLVARWEQRMEEERERRIFREHRSQLNRQAAALVKDQVRL